MAVGVRFETKSSKTKLLSFYYELKVQSIEK